jgi:hypothetical protein
MSDSSQVLKLSLGTPLAWLFSAGGDILRDIDGTPISKYLTYFEYEYSEEEDDTCTLKFEFESLNSFDLPYMQQDVVIHVQWGYILPNFKLLKSPIRKVAVRDVQSKYKDNGIEITLECTDLVSYIKLFKTRTIRNYSGERPNQKVIDTSNKLEDHFIDWIKEVAKDNFNATIIKDKAAAMIDKQGVLRVAEYNENMQRFTQARDNARVEKQMYAEFQIAKVIKGKSKALSAAIQDKLNLLNDAKKGGPFFMDSTDDTIQIKQRDFNKPIFKSYTYYGGTGELLRFEPGSNTRKIKEDKAITSGINPYSKKTETIHVETADLGKQKNKQPVEVNSKMKEFTQDDLEKANQQMSGNFTPLPNNKTVEAWIQDSREVFQYNIDNPLKQKELPALKYTVTKQVIKDPYMANGKLKVIQKIPAQTVLASSEFKAINEKIQSSIRANFHKESLLTGYTIEKIQRKFEADAEILGDPSIIKGKIIYINNVGRLDIGKWYIVGCKHKIDFKEGYTCTMDLIRNPATIKLNIKTYTSSPIYNRDSDDLKFEKNYTEEDISIYDTLEEDKETTFTSIDDVEHENVFREEQSIQAISDRLMDIKAEEDFLMNNQSGYNPDEGQVTTKPNNENS